MELDLYLPTDIRHSLVLLFKVFRHHVLEEFKRTFDLGKSILNMATEIVSGSLLRCKWILWIRIHSLSLMVRLDENVDKGETVFSISVKSQLNHFQSIIQMAVFIIRLLFSFWDLYLGIMQICPHFFLILDQLLVLSVKILPLLFEILVVFLLVLVLF